MVADLIFKSKKIFPTTIIYILIVFSLFAPKHLTSQTKEPAFFVDCAQFNIDKNLILLEIFYSIARQSVTYKEVQNGFQSKGIIKTYIMTPIIDWGNINTENPDSLKLWIDAHSKAVLIDSIQINDFVDSLEQLFLPKEIVDLSMVKVNQGDYELLSIFTDLNSKKKNVIRDYYYIRKYPKKKIALSSIVLANAITEADGKVLIFDRNDLRVIPNVRRGYVSGTPKMKFYIEIYNLSINKEAKDSTYNVEYFVFDQKGLTVLKSQDEPRKKEDVNAYIQGAINISDLPCAFYKFKIKITDNFTGKEAESEKNFYIHN
jgi:hypothetical protein